MGCLLSAALLAGLAPGMAGAQLAGLPIPDGWRPSAENTADLGEVGYRIVHPDSGIEMLFVPAGRFSMGSGDGAASEQPPHQVQMGGYWIGRTEVTVGQWRAVMGAVPEGHERGNEYPLTNVTWEQANLFCIKLGLRLPTEAEWEYAARGPDLRTYPWGDEWEEGRCCFAGDAPCLVGGHPEGASWCAALGMAGNVAEWCADWYAAGYYEGSPDSNPLGPTSGAQRVVRGGSWRSESHFELRGSARDSHDPADAAPHIGFRVAADG